MDEYEFTLEDRIAKIQAIDDQYDLNHNAYISLSGGKDSTVLHYLVDMALPGNKIPRLFLNTGMEWKEILNFVKKLAEKDDRIIIYNSGVNIKDMLAKVGYPFKSKQHSNFVSVYQHQRAAGKDGMCRSVQRYLGIVESNTFKCPEVLKYQFQPEFGIKISSRCCDMLKKHPAKVWAKENNKAISILGTRQGEGGQRQSHSECTTFEEGKLRKFKPLNPISDDWEMEFIKREGIELCELYNEPYNFRRTGCRMCPFALDLQQEIDIARNSPELATQLKAAEKIWKPVYDEYRRIGYRLRKEEKEE